jgi:HD-GYP domain-containing protein (c-di-GMP phosphodiesterase class II)
MGRTRIATDPVFWRDLASPELLHAVLRLPPGQNSLTVDEEYLDDIAAFAQVIDTKSPYTCGHSERVALFADMIAEQMGLAPNHRRWFRPAALLHDIGKLGVSDAILDKSDKLDDDEWVTMRAHAALSETILGLRVRGVYCRARYRWHRARPSH